MADWRKHALAVLVILVAGTNGRSLAADSPEVGPNLRVNDPQQALPNDFPTRTTISIAASSDGQRLLVGFEDYRGLCGLPFDAACPPENPSGLSGFAFSTDGGRSWTDGGAVPPAADGNDQTAGHSSVDVMIRGEGEDGQGASGRHADGFGETFFYASRLQDATVGTPLGASVHRGHFAGGTFVWDDVHVLNPASVNAAFSRQSIATAKDGSGAAYVIESDSPGICNTPFAGFGQIEVWRTHDGGDTWQGPAVVSPDGADIQDPNDPNCGASGFLQVASTVTVGTHGEVYVAWQRGAHLDINGNFSPTATIDFSRSLDGGVTFDPPRPLLEINSNRANQPVAYAKTRMNDQARLAVAMSGSYRGRLYLSFYQPVAPVSIPIISQSLVSTQSFLTYSDDQGKTWSAPQVIGPPVPATGVKRFWPTIGIRPDGEVDIAYLESQEVQLNPDPSVIECSVPLTPVLNRTGPAVSLLDTFMVRSRDGGVTFGAPVRISSQTGSWCNITFTWASGLLSNMGDYFGVWSSAADRTFIVWPDARNGFADVFFAAVQDNGGEASLSPIGKPPS